MKLSLGEIHSRYWNLILYLLSYAKCYSRNLSEERNWIARFASASEFLIVLKWLFCKLKMQYPWIRILLSYFLGPWSLEMTISTAKAPTAALTQSKRLVSRCRRGEKRPKMKQVVIMLGSVPLLFENCSKSRGVGDMTAEAQQYPGLDTQVTYQLGPPHFTLLV